MVEKTKYGYKIMNNQNTTWSILVDKGIVKGDTPLETVNDSPWYIKTLVGFSGWLASIFILGFIALIFKDILDQYLTSSIIGIIFIAGAFVLLKNQKSDFFEHIGLSLSLAGQVLIIYGIVNISNSKEAVIWGALFLMQTSLALIMPNFIHRVLSAFFAAFSFAAWLSVLGMPYLASGLIMFLCAWIWINEFSYPMHHRKVVAIGYGFALSLILIKSPAFFNALSLFSNTEQLTKPWMGETISSCVFLYVVWKLMKPYQKEIPQVAVIVTLIITLIFCIASYEVLGLSSCVMIILLGFSVGNRILIGFGIMSLLIFISSYYYLLEITLLEKSEHLFILGLIFIFLRWVLQQTKIWNKGESNE